VLVDRKRLNSNIRFCKGILNKISFFGHIVELGIFFLDIGYICNSSFSTQSHTFLQHLIQSSDIFSFKLKPVHLNRILNFIQRGGGHQKVSCKHNVRTTIASYAMDLAFFVRFVAVVVRDVVLRFPNNLEKKSKQVL
jgi:hypothetical protein